MAISENIELVKKWPGSGSLSAEKTPSILAYDDSFTKVTAWGHSVTDAYKTRFAHFKFFLNPRAPHDTINKKWDLEKATNASLPEGKTAEEVATDYLRALHAYIHSILENTYGERFLAAQDILYAFTVPVEWSDRTKALMVKIAEDAGFKGSITLVSEPEAAAIYCAALSDERDLRVGSKFLGTLFSIVSGC